MNVGSLFKAAEQFTVRNSPSILTAIGITGTITTAYLTGKASIKAVDFVREEINRVNHKRPEYEEKQLPTPRELLGMTWRYYVPPLISGTITIAAIFGANHVSSRRATAMATAYSISERAFSEYRDKIVEKVGEKKERSYRDEIAQERVERVPREDNSVIVTDGGEVLCFDHFTGRYFKSSMEALRRAENDINKQIIDEGYASLSEFYHLIGLKPTAFSDAVGWNTDYMLSVVYSTVLSQDGKPCIAIDFDLRPSNKFSHFAG